jgi:hypothetical protein
MNNNMNQGQQNSNFNQGMNQPNNNNNNQMMNPNMSNMNIQVLSHDNKNDINGIKNICMANISNNNAPKAISANLKNQFQGEWIVVVAELNDNFEFNVSEVNPNNVIVLQIEQKRVYICRYV